MRKSQLALFASMLSLAAVSFAQSPDSEIRESTDPARAADVEQRAMEIQQRQQSATSGSSGDDTVTDTKRSAKKKSMKKSRRAKAAEDTSGSSSGAGSAQNSGK